MKKAIALALAGGLLLVSGCSAVSIQVDRANNVSSPTEYTYYSEIPTVPSSVLPATEPTTATSAAPSTTLPPPATTAPEQTEPPATVSPTVRPQPDTTAPTTAPGTTARPSAPDVTGGSEVDLSITLPKANGTMEVSLDSGNKFIKTVRETRGIDPSLLAAVYAVPESGQNYVFEFRSAERTAENIRRVYLLDADGKIISVAASASEERENLSVTENWFCMTVLIKGMVFPAVQAQMQ